MVVQKPVGIGVIGTGWMGRFHAESVALRVPGATLAGIADPAPSVAAPGGSGLTVARSRQERTD